MFVKIKHSGPRSYVQLVESFRDESGRVKKRTVATLGRLDQLAGERGPAAYRFGVLEAFAMVIN